MLQTAQSGKKSKKSSTEKAAPKKSGIHERFLEAFRWMLLARILEDKLRSLYRGGMIVGGVYLGSGQEAVSAACGIFLQKGDVFGPLIRDQAGRFAFGEPLLDPVRTYLGSVKGPMRGRDGNIHRGRPRENQLAMISHLGAMVPVMVGKLLAKRMKGEKGFVGLTTIGEGGMQTGASHEGLNIAAVEQVPLVVVVTNNHWAYSTPNEREFACASLVDRAIGYGYEGHKIDGTDLNQCLEVIETAVKRARAGRPPQLVVAEVLRLSGHGEHDDASYVPTEMKSQPFAQDPVARTEKSIVEHALLDPHVLKQMRAEIAKEVDEAVAMAQQEDAPHASTEDWRPMSTNKLIDKPHLG
jgi:pyruvate dehydrogenase E1 component alpha subunit/2-oxoisovalerate dehydrogenase E1 component alpha subunit